MHGEQMGNRIEICLNRKILQTENGNDSEKLV